MGHEDGIDTEQRSPLLKVATDGPSEPVADALDAVISGESLTLRNISRRFGANLSAVDIDELSVEAGEFVALVGPSGCGKTTTMKMIAGLEIPTSGEIFVGGRKVNDIPVQQRNVGMVFQNYALYPNMSVRGNLEYSLKKRRDPKDARHRRVQEIAQLLDIDHLLDRRPKQLSGGEQQRVALGRALAKSPSLFLLDEPLSNLDAKLRNQMRRELVRLHRHVRSTILYVTHDQLEAMTMSHRIAVMQGGVVQQFDTPAEVYANPSNQFVAGFIGSPSMNFFPGTLASAGGEIRIETGLGILEPPPRIARSLAASATSGAVTVGVRPEAVLIAAGDPDKATLPMNGLVSLVENVGAELYVTISTAAGEIMSRVEAGRPVEVGGPVSFGFPAERTHVFLPSGAAVS
jgi:multiple sugar transport system ATP-binding protein